VTSLRERIDQDIKKAMLAKNEIARDAIRQVKSEMLLKEVELGHPLTDDEAIAVLTKSVKSRRDAIEEFKAGGRADLVEKEEAQLAVIAPYLPKTLDAAETRAAIEALATELGATTKKDMGRVMKELKARHGAAVDGKLASSIASEILK
jgi:uncharacterized protein YqeY